MHPVGIGQTAEIQPDRLDLEKRFNKILIGAEEGDPESQYCLGVLYNRKGENEKAVKAHQEAAEKGSSNAQYAIAFHYLRGTTLEKSIPSAMEYFRKTALNPNSSRDLKQDATHMTDFLEGKGR